MSIFDSHWLFSSQYSPPHVCLNDWLSQPCRAQAGQIWETCRCDTVLLLFLTSEGGPDRPEGDHEKLTARHCEEDQITLQPHPPDYHRNLSVLRPLTFQSS